jgi:alkylated DNA repair dioxygenase AlkB
VRAERRVWSGAMRGAPGDLEAGLRDLGLGGWLRYEPFCFPEHASLMAALLGELPLAQETIWMIGREVPVPRLVSFHGDPGRRYRYSGRDHDALPWTATLARIRDVVCARTGAPYDTVLCNFYRDGNDAMGRHADDEPELGPRRDDIRIASVSLGARRLFRLRPRAGGPRIDSWLGEGDLLEMGGTSQLHWVHEAPRTKAAVGPRLNLTFRCIPPRAR